MPLSSLISRIRSVLRADAPGGPPATPAFRLDAAPVDRPESDPIDGRDPLAYARQIADELERLKGACLAQGRLELAERLEFEINGYPACWNAPGHRAPAQIATPGYRTVDGELRGEIHGRGQVRPLPVPFAGPNDWQTSLGLRRLHDIPGLADALREGKTFFVIPQDESNPVLRREFSARFPESGYRIARTWLRVPVANVHKFVGKVAEYSRAMAAAADNKAPWM